MSLPVPVVFLSSNPSNRSGEMTEKRCSWPDTSAQSVLTQSARTGGAFGLDVDFGVALVAGGCCGGGGMARCDGSNGWGDGGLAVDSKAGAISVGRGVVGIYERGID